jgi:hypothetical protein
VSCCTFVEWVFWLVSVMYPREFHRRHSVDLLDLCGKINSGMALGPLGAQVGMGTFSILQGRRPCEDPLCCCLYTK